MSDTHPPGRQIRVFVSSTFRDMQADRDVLVKKVFPQLRKLCESRAVTWTEVDLRWGITSEQQAEGKVLPYCLAEIERSRPFFIGLLGERWRGTTTLLGLEVTPHPSCEGWRKRPRRTPSPQGRAVIINGGVPHLGKGC
jgi:hypothetical protein